MTMDFINGWKNLEQRYLRLNEKRKQVVHYTSIESKMFNEYRKNNNDINVLRATQKEKEDFTEYFL